METTRTTMLLTVELDITISEGSEHDCFDLVKDIVEQILKEKVRDSTLYTRSEDPEDRLYVDIHDCDITLY